MRRPLSDLDVGDAGLSTTPLYISWTAVQRAEDSNQFPPLLPTENIRPDEHYDVILVQSQPAVSESRRPPIACHATIYAKRHL